MSKSTRTITLTQVPTDTFETLAAMASDDGVGIAFIALRLIESAMVSMAEDPMRTMAELKVYAQHKKLQQALAVRSMLENIYREVVRNPTDESLAKLTDLCNQNGYTLEDIQSGLDDKAAQSGVGNDPDMDRLKTFLVQFVGDRTEVYAKEIIEAAQAAGWKDWQVTSARKVLGWSTVKRGKSFSWIIKTNVLKSILSGNTGDD